MGMGIYTLNTEDITYLDDILFDENKDLKIYSYKDLQKIPFNHILLFCVKYGIYNFPTLELIEFLKEEIKDDLNKTIEIAAGNGIMAKALGITATDNMMQSWPIIKKTYELAGQTPVKYGKNVITVDGIDAIKKYNPKIVIAAWLTHKYNPKEHWREGNEFGVKEEKVIEKCKYIFIGNEKVHKNKPILDIPHKTIKPEWLISRSMEQDKNVIWIWEKNGGK